MDVPLAEAWVAARESGRVGERAVSLDDETAALWVDAGVASKVDS